jgi:general stress protein CsbA
MSVVATNSDRKSETRRRSMQGTVLFAVGIIATLAAAATGSVWLVGAAVVLLVPGAVMLYQVGRSLR